MQQNDDVVSAWLNGSELDNPAGPLFLDRSVEDTMTSPSGGMIFTTMKTTQSCVSGCICC
jgi:hypothetical protein